MLDRRHEELILQIGAGESDSIFDGFDPTEIQNALRELEVQGLIAWTDARGKNGKWFVTQKGRPYREALIFTRKPPG